MADAVLDLADEGADLVLGEVALGVLGEAVVVVELAVGRHLEAVELAADVEVAVQGGPEPGAGRVHRLADLLELDEGLAAAALDLVARGLDQLLGLVEFLGAHQDAVLGGPADQLLQQDARPPR